LCYSNKTESVNLRKCPHDHWLTNKAYLSAITVTNISKSFTYKMAAKINWLRYEMLISSLSRYVFMSGCQSSRHALKSSCSTNSVVLSRPYFLTAVWIFLQWSHALIMLLAIYAEKSAIFARRGKVFLRTATKTRYRSLTTVGLNAYPVFVKSNLGLLPTLRHRSDEVVYYFSQAFNICWFLCFLCVLAFGWLS